MLTIQNWQNGGRTEAKRRQIGSKTGTTDVTKSQMHGYVRRRVEERR